MEIDVNINLPDDVKAFLAKTPEQFTAEYEAALASGDEWAQRGLLYDAQSRGIAIPKSDGSGFYNDPRDSTAGLRNLSDMFKLRGFPAGLDTLIDDL